QTGQSVRGHRAADFSISRRFLHVLECLSEEGLSYDSSIFPVWHRRYGVPEAWRHPHLIRCASGRRLVEFPLPPIRLGEINLAAAGGGYFRLFPYWWTRLALQTLEREGFPATCYVHPYETDTFEMDEIPYQVPALLSWSQSTNRRSVQRKLRKLLSTFHFITLTEACEKLLLGQLEVGLDLGRTPASYGPQPARSVSSC